MSETLDLSREILGIVADQSRPAGHQVASTVGTQSAPVGNSGDGQVQRLHPQSPGDLPDRDDRGPAMRNSANDVGWRPQDRAEMKAYRETVQFLAAVSGVATVDPNLCVNFWITGAGNITITMVPFEVPDFDGDDEAPTLVQSSLVTLYVQRQEGTAIIWPAGIAWSADIRDAMASNSPFGPASGDQVDVFTLQHIPAPVDTWFAFIAATRMA